MKQRLEEIKLLAMCMATDNRDAFSRLVEMHSPGLRRFLLNLTNGDACLTDDLSQETFIKAWLGIRSFQGISGFRTWLYRIAINEFISYRRRFANRPENGAVDASEINIPSESFNHSSTEARMDVSTVLATLPDGERAVALLFYLEDLPIKKICQITSMPEGTVKSYLHRARAKMAKALNK